MLKLIIAGGRNFNNYALLKEKVDYYLQNNKEDVEIISGKASGADFLGEKYAKEKGYPIVPFPAEWSKYGPSAGPRRNEEMARYANVCIVFWDGQSTGTGNMIKNAMRYSLKLKIVKYAK